MARSEVDAGVETAAERGRAFLRLAEQREAAGDTAGALELFAEALGALEPVTRPGDPDRDRALVGLGDTAYALRDLALAEPARRRLLEERLATLGGSGIEVASAMHGLAKVHLAAGDLEAAETLIRPALGIFEKELGADSAKVAHLLGDLALVERRRGDFAEARRWLERALAVYELRFGPEHLYVAGILNNLGGVLSALGDLPEARAAHERALAIREAVSGPDSSEVAQSLSNLGSILIREHEPEAAVPLLERALAIRERTLGEDAPGVALTLNNLGFALFESGEPERARAVLERAIAVFEDQPLHAQDLADALTNHGVALLRLDRLDGTVASLDRARSISESTRGHDHPRTAAVIEFQARAEAVRGRYDRAIGLALEAERITREHLRLTAAGLSEREALLFAEQQREALNLSLSLLSAAGVDDPTLVSAGWEAVIRSRGAVLEEMARRRLFSAVAEVNVLDDARSAAATRLSRLLLKDRTADRASGELAAARLELEGAERALGEASASFARDLDRGRIGFDEVASSLPADGCLVAYVRFDRSPIDDPEWRGRGVEPHYLALVLGPDRTAHVVLLGGASVVDEAARSWRALASLPRALDGELEEAGDLLRRTVWDPPVRQCGDARRVFVVPDGELGLVNLAALPGRDGGFLVEEEPLLAVLDSERDLVGDPFAPVTGPCMLAVGALDFDAARGGATAADREPDDAPARPGLLETVFPSLPASGIESSVAAKLWTEAGPGFTALELRGSDASEKAFRILAPGSRVLHLATHGLLLRGGDTFHGGGLRGVGGLAPAAGVSPQSASEPEVRISALVLAGANRAESPASDDGVLTAEEIATLDLSGLEWAVLSACESGVGRASTGEGVFGLRRAFRTAGARTVITALWPVDDEVAREWMAALYRARLEGGLATPEAVRAASLEVLAARRARGASVEPASWAAFLAVGDWR